MTAEEFAEAYARRSGVTVEELRAHGREPRPCHCDYEQCEGWQMVNAKDYDADVAWKADVARKARANDEADD